MSDPGRVFFSDDREEQSFETVVIEDGYVYCQEEFGTRHWFSWNKVDEVVKTSPGGSA